MASDAAPDVPATLPDTASDVAPDAAPDRAPDTATSCYARYPTALFCHDFDDSLAVAPPSKVVTSANASMTQDPTVVKQGTHAARLNAGDAPAPNVRQAHYQITLPQPVGSGGLWARLHVRLGPQFTIPAWLVPLEFIYRDDRIKVYFQDSAVHYEMQPSNYRIYSSNNLPRDRWFCIELGGTVGENGQFGWWLDGVLQGQTPVNTRTTPTTGPAWDGVQFGLITDATSTPGLTMHVDDMVVARTRIGCN
jgi:hypothetical protein